ncbi:AraC family transcriptional regulator [Bacillus sp. B1-b2]|uniref:AraC family transcriptional regulator n=1 Tax=Bacillus sp. B1-b2 TaxID=2653201 RepID=UPI001261DB53|nr:AraC family transcriptional regulator [Bacillus sp. B1-b2]KAB7671992.1 AraC family transcriptional regulator [Bacillus sp. B1-b2]
MTWLEGLQQALSFIESNLTKELETEEIARKANVSSFHFQRTFAILTDVTLGEYIRRRRLTLAGNDLLHGKEKIIEIAFKYGYETPEAFTKAYRKQHGVTPSDTRKGIGSLQVYNPLVIQVQLKGAEPMKVRMVEKEGFSIIGIKRSYSFKEDENLREIPKLWEEVNSNGTTDDLITWNNGELKGILGVCVDKKDDMDYWVAVSSTKSSNHLYQRMEIPSTKWAIFEVHGPMPHSMQKVWKQIYSEWLPTNNYQQSGNISFEFYSMGNPTNENYYSEIWIPIK